MLQALELVLTVLATALPAILTAIVVLEFLGIARISQRLNILIRSMESSESLDSVLASTVTESSAAPADSKRSTRKKKKTERIKPSEEKDQLFEEPVEIDDVPIELVFPDEPETPKPKVSDEAPPTSVKEPLIFGDVEVPDDEFADFELVVKKDGSFDLKSEEEEEETK
ncbi:MAG: hypothetical protein ACFFD3_11200 [Candidatus Thorarchaeota archaeon]